MGLGTLLKFRQNISSKRFCYCIMSFLSSENPKCSSKSLKFPKNNDYLNEKMRSLKKSRSGYVSAITRAINKLIDHINLNSDVKEIQRYEFKL